MLVKILKTSNSHINVGDIVEALISPGDQPSASTYDKNGTLWYFSHGEYQILPETNKSVAVSQWLASGDVSALQPQHNIGEPIKDLQSILGPNVKLITIEYK
jgi:hypothetical protein